MKILFLATDVYGANGGIAKFNSDLIRSITTFQRCDEIIVLPFANHGEAPSLPKLNYFPVNTGHKTGKFFYISHVLKQAFKIKKKDLIICGHINFIPVAYLAHILSGAPVYLIIHGIDAWGETKSLITNLLIKKIDNFISVSDLTRQRFLDWTGFKKEGLILPNCVNLSYYSPGPANQGLIDRYNLKGKKVILTLARLVSLERYKGIDEVFEVMPDLLIEFPNLVYIVCGDGNDRKRLEEKAKKLGIADKVIFTGFIRDEEKVDHYRLADVFVMPGRGEGFGIVYLEALACGIPVIGSKTDGSREALMGGKLGAIVDPTNKEELKLAIFEALKKPKSEVSEDLRYFSYQNFEKRCHQIINSFFAPAT